jgi:glycosyltransferase involved in cell wall biosynthesis
MRQLTLLSLRLASASLFISQDEFENAERFEVRNPQLVMPCVDTLYYTPDADARRDCILTISHLNHENVERKRIPEIIEAFSLVLHDFPDERLAIVGDLLGGYEPVRARAERLGVQDRVLFCGRVSRDRKLDLLRHAKVYLQPSRYEGFGYAIGEAMACAVPVVVTRTGALPEVVGDAGIYVEGATPRELADVICAVLSDPDFGMRLGQSARDRITKSFSYERRRHEIHEIIQGLQA